MSSFPGPPSDAVAVLIGEAGHHFYRCTEATRILAGQLT